MTYQDSYRDCSNFICSNNSGKKKKVEMASTLARRWLPGVSELPSRYPPPRCCWWKVCPAETLIAPRGGQTPNSEEPSLPRAAVARGRNSEPSSFLPSQLHQDRPATHYTLFLELRSSLIPERKMRDISKVLCTQMKNLKESVVYV